MVDFSQLVVGKTYDRNYLAALWGYHSFNAISRGVFTPQNQNVIVFFVTRDKQESLTQYEDHIDRDILFWEGEKGHGSDKRIIGRTDEIHIFYRDRHHSDFTYEGRADLNYYHIFADRPSKFTFTLIDQCQENSSYVAEEEPRYGFLGTTEREALTNVRIGQDSYREGSIRLWNECSLTGFTKTDVLIASHIKPWRVASNEERINPFNSLLLVPTVDKLFDRGYISFDTEGRIMLSEKIAEADYARINISPDLRLRKLPDKTKPFLEYHCEYIFDLVEQ